MNQDTPKISIIIPIHNEENYLFKFLPELVWKLNKTSFNWQLIVSENGSSDNTLQLAQEYAKRTKDVQVLTSPNPDYGLAVKKGFLAADGDYLVLFDLDYYDTNFIDQAILKMNKYDVVVGSKLDPESQDTRSIHRRFATLVFSSILKMLFGLKISDTHGIKILKRKKFLPLIKQSRMTKELFDTELLLRAQKNNFEIGELPISVIEKRQSRSSIFVRGLKTLKDLVKLKFYFLRENLSSWHRKSIFQYWPMLALVIISLLIMKSSLQLPFSLIDDGLVIDKSNEFVSKITNLNFRELDWLLLESRTGRSRPIFWLFMFIQYWFVGNNSFTLHILRIIFSASLISLVYYISYKLTKSKFVGILASLPALLFYRNVENFYRLVSQEIPMTLFLLLGIVLAFEFKKKWLGKIVGPLLILSAILTKETAIFVVPLLLLGLLIDKENEKTWQQLFLTSLIGIAYIFIARFFNYGKQNYSSNFKVDLQTWFKTFQEYKLQLDSSWLSRLLQLSGISLVIAAIKKDRLKISLISLVWLSASFLILLPWKLALGRYLTPVLPAIGLFIAFETYRQIKYSLKNPIFVILLGVFVYYWANFIFTNTIQSLNIATDFVAREKANAVMVDTAVKSMPKNSTLYFNFEKNPNHYEWISEAERHFRLFHNRSDLKTSLFNEKSDVEFLATWSFPDNQIPISSLSDDVLLKKIETKTQQYNPILKDSLKTLVESGTPLIPTYSSSYIWHLHKL